MEEILKLVPDLKKSEENYLELVVLGDDESGGESYFKFDLNEIADVLAIEKALYKLPDNLNDEEEDGGLSGFEEYTLSTGSIVDLTEYIPTNFAGLYPYSIGFTGIRVFIDGQEYISRLLKVEWKKLRFME
jgi:hypothetical protein